MHIFYEKYKHKIMKNTITNIFGLILWLIAIYELIFTDYTVYEITALIVIGGVLFLFSNNDLKDLLKSIVSSKKDNFLKSKVGGEIPRTDDE